MTAATILANVVNREAGFMDEDAETAPAEEAGGEEALAGGEEAPVEKADGVMHTDRMRKAYECCMKLKAERDVPVVADFDVPWYEAPAGTPGEDGEKRFKS